jgi:oxygen-independent coproporphyrinogen-3 oxidase
VSAISAVGATYSQNVKSLDAYYERIDSNELPIERGIELTMDDVLRRSLIQTLMCHFELSISAIEQGFPIVFAKYFADELESLRALEADGLVVLGPEYLSVTQKGRLLIRNICMVFDRYLSEPPALPRYSKTI